MRGVCVVCIESHHSHTYDILSCALSLTPLIHVATHVIPCAPMCSRVGYIHMRARERPGWGAGTLGFTTSAKNAAGLPLGRRGKIHS